MTELVALNNQTHRVLRIAVEQARREAGAAHLLSVVPREFPRLVGHYPIFFAKSAENGQIEPAVLLGFKSGENLFMIDGNWDAAYVPLQVQRQPFSLIPRRDAVTHVSASLDLALDVSRPYVQAVEGERLFTDDGQASPFLQNIGSIMKALVTGSREAHTFTATLVELNLLETVQIDIEFADTTKTKMEGLYWIAAAALKALPASALAELRDLGHLEWLYFQMASLAHVSALVARKNRLIATLGGAMQEGTATIGHG